MARWVLWMMLLAMAAGCGKQPEAAASKAVGTDVKASAMVQDGYVWQRRWTQGVRESVAAAQGKGIGEVVVLALEMKAEGGGVEVFTVAVDWGVLKGLAGGVGLGVRIHPYGGSFEKDGAVIERVIGEVKGLLVRAEREGVKVREVQIDFDAAQGKLEGYRVWVEAVKEALGEVRVEVTVLPSWMEEATFVPLVKACDGYVLQVHALAFGPGGEAVICDVEKSRKWIAQAEGLGVPFRVALPTYGYTLAYDAQGKRIGLEAEGGYRGARGVARRVDVESDAAALAGFVKELKQARWTAMKGVIWYRLPVAEDYRNWRWQTLEEVMAGRVPEPILKVELAAAGETGQSGEVFDVVVSNTGTGDAALGRARVVMEGVERFDAADGVAGFEVSVEKSLGRMVMKGAAGRPGKLRAGEKRVIGWVRFKPGASKEAVGHVEWD